MAGAMSVDGIISGLNTQDIITKLMELKQGQVKRLQNRQATLTQKLTSWQDLNIRTLALKNSAATLADPGKFDARIAKSDDESLLTATASSEAITGTYYLKVNQTAMAHQIQSQGYEDMYSSIGTGTVDITVAGKKTTINIDSSNNTLVGLKDTINRANTGVKAAIIDTGNLTDPAQRYKLIVTSNSTGKSNEITVTNNLTGGTAPEYTELQAALNCKVSLGNSGITVERESNTVTDFLPGVTLNVKASDVNKIVTLSVQQDNDTIKKSVSDFVDQYNNIIDFFKQQFNYDKETGKSGTLFGDFSLLNIQSELARVVGDSIPQLSEGLRTLNQLGIRSDVSGKLTINNAELEKALNTKITEVKSVFSAMGTATDPGVVFVSSTVDTKASTNGYSLEISRIATKSRVTAGIAQATGASGQLTQNETLTINGVNIDLQAGWTSDQVLAAINARSKECGVSATRTDINGQGTGDYLTLTAIDYGSLGRITVKSSISNTSGVNTGFGNVEVTPVGYGGESGAGTGKVGYDVAGKIDGKSATGSGQSLSVTDGDAKGLTIIVTGGTIGSRGVVKFSRGIGSLVAAYVNSITDKYGALTTAQDSINKQIDGIKQDITELDNRLKREETLLYVKFSAMETALAKLQSQSAALASLPTGGMLSKPK